MNTHSPIIEELNKRKCSWPRGSHAPCSGSATSKTENYIPQVAQIIIDGVLTPRFEHCMALSAQSRSFSTVQALSPTSALDLSYASHSPGINDQH